MLRKMTKKELDEAEAVYADDAYRRRGELNRQAIAVLSGKVVPLTVHLKPAELEQAQQQAKKKNLRINAYLTGLVREALKCADPGKLSSKRAGPRRRSESA
jgi:hypothetical protein